MHLAGGAAVAGDPQGQSGQNSRSGADLGILHWQHCADLQDFARLVNSESYLMRHHATLASPNSEAFLKSASAVQRCRIAPAALILDRVKEEGKKMTLE